MSFLEDALKDAVKAAVDVYKENSRVSGLLEDKAQKAGGLAGIFLAAAFGFVKTGEVKAFTYTYSRYSGFVLIVTLILFIACLAVCLSVMWVRVLPAPLGIAATRAMLSDFATVHESEITDEVRQNFYAGQLAIWEQITQMQQKSIASKGKRLRMAQALLGTGMLLIASILIGIVLKTARG